MELKLIEKQAKALGLKKRIDGGRIYFESHKNFFFKNKNNEFKLIENRKYIIISKNNIYNKTILLGTNIKNLKIK